MQVAAGMCQSAEIFLLVWENMHGIKWAVLTILKFSAHLVRQALHTHSRVHSSSRAKALQELSKPWQPHLPSVSEVDESGAPWNRDIH